MKIIEFDLTIIEFLKKRQLLSQYQKVKNKLRNDDLKSVKFRKRKPLKLNQYYFRINLKYRAIGKFKQGVFVVAEISKHQEK